MLKLKNTAYRHEDVFIEHYEWLLGWSLRLTEHNQEEAEDLLHDAFVQFTLAGPDLNKVQNLEGYLYGMLRNMHVSQIRRAVRKRNRVISILDHDSAEMGLRCVDPYTEFQCRDQLQKICDYACARKETSKAGSVLILRFFQGYYPKEIAKILGSPRNAVDDWLRIARKEAHLHLQNPPRKSLLKKKDHREEISDESPDFLGRLRQTIFRSRRGFCLSADQLDDLYCTTSPSAIDCTRLAHIASCPNCLDEINKRLGIPPLSERHPIDTIGQDAPSNRKAGNFKVSASQIHQFVRQSRCTTRDVFEHRPKDLQLTVNGFMIGSQSIGSERNEQTLSINLEERIGFIEAFSEQEVRLLYFNVEPPPDGATEQTACMELSEGRRVEVSINFSDIRPRLTALYYDPLLKPAYALQQSTVEIQPLLQSNEEVLQTPASLPEPPRFAFQPRLSLFSLQWWLRPAWLTAALASILIIALLLVPRPGSTLSASELFDQSVAAEEARLMRTDVIIHQVINFEEHQPDDDTVTNRRRIEIWMNMAKGLTARRVYNEKNELIAAAWTTLGEQPLVYRRDMPQQLQRQSKPQLENLLGTDDAWLLDVSAKDYGTLIRRVDLAKVQEKGDAYIITYQNHPATVTGKLVKAVLTISKNDFHPVEEILTVKQKNAVIQYRFAEQSFEPLATETVAPSVFQIDSHLLRRNVKIPESLPIVIGSAPTEPSPAGAASFAQQKVAALYALHRAGACLREQPEVTQTADGELHIQAVVDSEARKRELLRALEAATGTPTVKIEIYTVAEAVKQYMKVPQAPAISRRVEVSKDQIPVYAELRRYFSKPPKPEEQSSTDSKVDEQIRQFASLLLNQSREALLHVWALKHYTREVSEAELASLDATTRANWYALIRDHLRAFEQETRLIRQELQPVFFDSGAFESAAESGPESTGGLWHNVERLFKFATSHDAAIRKALTVSTDNSNGLLLKNDQFRVSLKNAESLAKGLQNF